MIILDTDILIEIFDKESKKGEDALQKILNSNENISTTTINLHEILYGLQKYAKPAHEILQLPIINYTKTDANLSAKIELDTERKGTPIRRTDTMIAAITINNSASLYTLDQKHFQPLTTIGLKIFS